MLTVIDQWEAILEGERKDALEAMLPAVLMTRRWFGGKARPIQSVRIVESVPLPSATTSAVLLFLLVEYQQGPAETYLLPVTAAFGEKAAQVQRDLPHAVVAPFEIRDQGQAGVLYDALWNSECTTALLHAIGQDARLQGRTGTLIASPTTAYREMVRDEDDLTAVVMKAEQSNTSVEFDSRVILKLYRRQQEGLNPDLEIGRVLTVMNFPHSPAVGGAIEYVRPDKEPVTVAILQAFVKNRGDAWKYTLEAVDGYLVRFRPQPVAQDGPAILRKSLLELAQEEIPAQAREMIGSYLDSAKLLGQRTAELHVTLAQCRDNPAFTPEPLSAAYRRDRYESMRRLTEQTFALLQRRVSELPVAVEKEARWLLENKSEIMARFRAFLELESTALRIRCHGDYHLGQVLWTGEDFVIVDFEGEPARPLHERRTKHPPMLDVAGMLRSFVYAAYAAAAGRVPVSQGEETLPLLEPRLMLWYGWVSAEFLKGYMGIAGDAPLFPRHNEDDALLNVYMLEKTVYELAYELNNRPDWIGIPVRGLAQLLKQR